VVDKVLFILSLYEPHYFTITDWLVVHTDFTENVFVTITNIFKCYFYLRDSLAYEC